MQLAFLASLPAAIGALGQLLGLWVLQFLRTRRALIASAVLINAIVWIPIAILSLMLAPSHLAVWCLLGLLVIYYASGGFAGPAWNSLMGDMVPEDIRGSYFGLRNRSIGMFTFISMLAAGQLLHLSNIISAPEVGYLVIFCIAGLSRMLSTYWLQKYDDPPHLTSHHHYFSFWQFIRRAPSSNFARFVIYVAIINGAVAFSGPFFTVYMLRDLQLTYFEFTLVAGASVLVQFLTMQYWGKLADLFGSKKMMNILSFGVVLAPALWLGGDSLFYIILVQFFSGAVWAGFNLAAATFLFDAVTPAKRARCTAYQAVMNGTLVTIGAVLGGLCVEILPSSVALPGWEWSPKSPLLFLFIISALVRLLAAIIFLPRFREVSEVEPIKHFELLFRITGLRPISGVSFGIITDGARRRYTRVQRKQK
jgi:MFS family permease